MKRLRVGVAGLGFGAAVHVPALRALPDVEVVAIAGSSAERARSAADELGIPTACGSVDELLDRELDAVSFALPPHVNEAACRIALSRRLPVLSEKPLAVDAAAASELAALARSVPTAVDFQFAELPCFQVLKRAVDDGAYGRVRHVAVTWLVESWAQKQGVWSWKTDAARGGGAISLFGSHLFFLLEWLFGGATELAAFTNCSATRRFAPAGSTPADDRCSLLVRHASGVEVAAAMSNAAPQGTGHRWEIVFDGGTAVLYNPGPDYMAGFTLTMRTKDDTRVLCQPATGDGIDGRMRPFGELASRFGEAVRTGGASWPDFENGARVQTLMEAAQLSRGGSVHVGG